MQLIMSNVLNIQKTTKNTAEPPISLNKPRCKLDIDIKRELVKEVAIKSFAQLVISLTFVSLACIFVATPFGMATLFIAAIGATALNILFRSLNAYAFYKVQQLESSVTNDDKSKKQSFQLLENITDFLAPMSFSALVDSPTRLALTGHLGQGIGAQLLYKKPEVSIILNQFKEGQISIIGGELSKIGQYFGRSQSELLMTMAGPGLDIISASVGIGAALVINESYPDLSRYLKMMAIDSVVQNVFKALAVLIQSGASSTNDFVQLWAGGIHPITAIIGMIAIPVFIKVGFFIYEKIKLKRLRELNKDQLNPHIMVPTKTQSYRLLNPASA